MARKRGKLNDTGEAQPAGADENPRQPESQPASSGDKPGQPESPEIATTTQESKPEILEWPQFLEAATDDQVRRRLFADLTSVEEHLPDHLKAYQILVLLEPRDSIGEFDLNQLYNALSTSQPKQRDVLLIIVSRGGSVEPAYQIAKVCKAYSKDRFIVAVPREAKSAATLIAIGADEIHMGPLGQLGPIDPQLNGLPALGVSQALQTIASFVQMYPRSAEMFARYLRMALTVEQIGYCERVSESAVQYAERLLSTKATVAQKASVIARELVYEYKDHSFVIDLEEAQKHLGVDWIKTDTAELDLAERLYRYFDWVNLHFGFHQSKRLLVFGALSKPTIIIFSEKE